MKKWLKQIIAVCMCMVLAAGTMTGCSGQDGSPSSTLLFSYDGEKVFMNEAWMYAKTVQSSYETFYGANIWSYEVQDDQGNPATFEDMVKKDVIEQIKMTKFLVKQADSMKVSLSDKDKEDLADQAKAFYAQLSSEDKKKTDASEEILIKLYQENALAQAVYQKIIDEGKITVPKEEYEQTSTYNLLFATFTEDKNGNQVDFDAAQKAKQKKRAKKALKELKNGADIEELAQVYEEDKSSAFNYGATDDIAPEYRAAAAKLKDGEISPIVESDFGYHIIKMIKKNDKEASQKRKDELLEKKQKEYFEKKYKEMTRELEEKWDFNNDVNQKAYKSITFASTDSKKDKASTEGTQESTTGSDATTTQ